MIKPDGIPIAPLHHLVESLELNVGPMRDLGQPIVDVGNNVHSTFGRLEGCYQAPERDLLIHSTQKVQKNLGEFGRSLPRWPGTWTGSPGRPRGTSTGSARSGARRSSGRRR